MRSTFLLVALLLGGSICAAQEAVPAEDVPPLSQLPHRLLADFTRLATPTPLLILGTGGALALGAHNWDRQTVVAVSGTHPVEEALDAGSVGGSGYVQAGAAVGMYALGKWSHQPTTAAFGADLVEAQLVAAVLTHGIKFAADRSRPDGGRGSFPSGHASATFATAAVIEERFGWRYGAAAYAGAAYVAASRVADRQHYPSDVIFGAAIGAASAHTLRWTSTSHVALWPVVMRHGAVVMASVR
jgi:membrane-associated phospholipid phosphatase